MTEVIVNPEVIEAGNVAARKAIRRQIRELEIKLRSIAPVLSVVHDERD